METILNSDYSYAAKILAYTLSILIPALIGVLVGYIKKRYNIEQINEFTAKLGSYKLIATMACRMAEQMYNDKGGPAKLAAATQFVIAELAKMGVTLTEDEVNSIIHAALRELKDELGSKWDYPQVESYTFSK